MMAKATAHSLRSFNREKGIFELITQSGKNVQVVNLQQKTCTCGKWEVFKYPCSHVLSACAKLSLNSWQYVDKWYSIVKYCDTWSSEFSPYLMKRIGHKYRLENWFQIQSSYEIKKVVHAQRDYEMEWILKKGEVRTFAEIVSKVVTIEKNVRQQGRSKNLLGMFFVFWVL